MTAARDHDHALLYNALTHAVNAMCGTDRTDGIFIPLSLREQMTRDMLDHLARHDATIYAHPDPGGLRPATPADVAERLTTLAGPTLAGPTGASRTVEINRTELADLAATLHRHTTTARPFHGDALDYSELHPNLLGWRAALNILAVTGATAEIPTEYLPTAVAVEIIAGWTLRPHLRPGTTPGTVAVTATRTPLPTATTEDTTA